jgi:GT2 family glycosyltransferase
MNPKHQETIGVVFITHAAKQHLPFCLPPYLHSPLKPRVLVVNSSSNDGTVEEAERLGAETLIIPRNEFNHGSTRERARKYLETDIVVMTTPDAYPVDEHVLEKLTRPLFEGKAAVSYARQIPHDGAGIFEAFPRYFNYPEKSHVRGIEDLKKYGVYTFFCSDTCAAYKNSALDEIGGFRSVLTAEDYFAVALLLQKGHKIAYVAEAVVKHSHRYTLGQEFRRYFDTGYTWKENHDLIRFVEKAEGRGKEFFLNLMKRLLEERPLLIPYAALNTFVKWCGYRMGWMSTHAPLWLRKKLSGQDFYWRSKDFLTKGKNDF